VPVSLRALRMLWAVAGRGGISFRGRILSAVPRPTAGGQGGAVDGGAAEGAGGADSAGVAVKAKTGMCPPCREHRHVGCWSGGEHAPEVTEAIRALPEFFPVKVKRKADDPAGPCGCPCGCCPVCGEWKAGVMIGAAGLQDLNLPDPKRSGCRRCRRLSPSVRQARWLAAKAKGREVGEAPP